MLYSALASDVTTHHGARLFDFIDTVSPAERRDFMLQRKCQQCNLILFMIFRDKNSINPIETEEDLVLIRPTFIIK